MSHFNKIQDSTDIEVEQKKLRMNKIIKWLERNCWIVGVVYPLLLAALLFWSHKCADSSNLINILIGFLNFIIATIAIIASFYISNKTLIVNETSLKLETEKEEIVHIQQELANRFEKFSPIELVSCSLFKGIPSKEDASETIDNLLVLYCKCQELSVSANILYSDNGHPESKEFLKSYKDMIDTSSWFILGLLFMYREEDQAAWESQKPLLICCVDILIKKYNTALRKANKYISVLNKEYNALYEIRINNIHDLERIDFNDLLKKEEEEEEEEENEIENNN